MDGPDVTLVTPREYLLAEDNAALRAQLAVYDEVAHDKDGTPFAAASAWRAECNKLRAKVEALEAHYKVACDNVEALEAQVEYWKNWCEAERNKHATQL